MALVISLLRRADVARRLDHSIDIARRDFHHRRIVDRQPERGASVVGVADVGG